jgi:predicted pyridoxine 5'-phosphate oxidase superfamily flavin-nucleotide-binding protein
LVNITENPKVSLAFWKGLKGYRVTATAEQVTHGPLFDDVVAWIGETIPGRVVKGVLILTPEKLFDISAGPEAGKRIDAN